MKNKEEISISEEQEAEHAFLIGTTGFGKSRYYELLERYRKQLEQLKGEGDEEKQD